ncbi:MAG: transposase [Bacillota bacterium]|nr:transposase [Bacillota bacterium]
MFWSGGYFACSIKEVSYATIQRYIKSQEIGCSFPLLKEVGLCNLKIL